MQPINEPIDTMLENYEQSTGPLGDPAPVIRMWRADFDRLTAARARTLNALTELRAVLLADPEGVYDMQAIDDARAILRGIADYEL